MTPEYLQPCAAAAHPAPVPTDQALAHALDTSRFLCWTLSGDLEASQALKCFMDVLEARRAACAERERFARDQYDWRQEVFTRRHKVTWRGARHA